GHALRDPRQDVPGGPAGGPILADRADDDRAPLRREPSDPRAARPQDARGCPLFSDRAPSRETDREAAGTEARAFRHLVRGLQAARQPYGSGARRDRAAEVSDGRGLQEGHPEPPRQARLLETESEFPREQPRPAPGARLTA